MAPRRYNRRMVPLSADTSAEIERMQVDAWRAMTPAEKASIVTAGGGISDRQWRDVRSIVRVQGTALDRDYLRAQAPVLGVADLLERALSDET
jgi:hypothetical protein